VISTFIHTIPSLSTSVNTFLRETMAAASYYMPVPPAGTYPPQQPAGYPGPPYQWQPQYAPSYPPQQPAYLQDGKYPYQPQPSPYQPQQAFQPSATHASEYRSPSPRKPYDPKAIWDEYNNPPDPQYGIPESQRGQNDQAYSRNANTQAESGQNGERGLGAAVVGGGAGAFLGHKFLKNHKTLGAVGGLALGAIAAEAFEHHEKEKRERRREDRAFDEGYDDGEDRPSRERGIDVDDCYEDETYVQDDDYYDSRGDRYDDRQDDYYDDSYYQQDDYRNDYYERRDDWTDDW
jgi:hypothetical protein